MKRNIRLSGCLIILAILLCLPVRVQAADQIKANKWYSGSIAGGHTKEFQLTMPYDGYVLAEGCDSGSLENLTTKTAINWSGYKNFLSEDLTRKGNKLVLKYSGSNGTVKSYKTRLRVFKKKYFESEKNNSRKKADKIKKGKTYTGFLEENDKDWFVFKAPKTGTYNITMQFYEKNAGYDLKAASYVGSKKNASVTVNGKTNVFSGKVKKGGRVYVKVSPSLYSGVLYQLKVS